ncbi:MAG: hypothetical protein V1874_14265 [Spirochaetota bacterium]
MKSRVVIIAGVAAASIMLLSSPVKAIGLGVYLTGSVSHYNWTYQNYDYSYTDEEISHKSNGYKAGGGFILDTALAYDRLFNYRLNLGGAYIKLYNDSGVPDLKGTEFHCYNSFGFGVYRSEDIRVWAGPQIGFGMMEAEYDMQTSGVYEYNSFWTVFFSIGAIAGINYNYDNRLSLCFDAGFRYSSHGGEAEIRDKSWDDVVGKQYEGFIDVCFLFRINDEF